jgi:hypothetical protein
LPLWKTPRSLNFDRDYYERSLGGIQLAVTQEHQTKAPKSNGAYVPSFNAPDDSSGLSLARVIGLSGAPTERALVPIRIGLAIAVFVLAMTSEGMETARTLWMAVVPIAILYAGFDAYCLWRGRVREAIALGIVGDLTLTSLMLPILYYIGSRDDPGNLTYMAEPGVALVTLAILMSTMRLTIWPAVTTGIFMTVVPSTLAWYLTADGVSNSGLGGDVLTFAAAIVFTLVGQTLQRTRRTVQHQLEKMEGLYDDEIRRSSERELLAEIV